MFFTVAKNIRKFYKVLILIWEHFLELFNQIGANLLVSVFLNTSINISKLELTSRP